MALIKHGHIDMKHEDPSGTLQWGKVGDKPAYIRIFPAGKWDCDENCDVLIDDGAGGKVSLHDLPGATMASGLSVFSPDKSDYVFVVYASPTDKEMVVVVATADLAYQLPWEDDEAWGEFKFRRYVVLTCETDWMTKSVFNAYINFIKHVYVSTYLSPTGSLLPVMWQTTWDDRDRKATDDQRFQMPIICGSNEQRALVTNDDCTHMFWLYESAFPKVDLEVQSSMRYEEINLVSGAQIYYNRNYKAWNGNVASAVKLLPCLFEELWLDLTHFFQDKNIQQDLLRLANDGVVEKDILVSTEETVYDTDGTAHVDAPDLPGITTDDNPVKEEQGEKMHESNILLRAAKASDTRYE